jgi:peptide/nickel transport system permease protein
MHTLRRYLITRILLTIPMVFVLVTLVFIILRVMPGDPVKAAIRPGAPQEYIDEIRHTLGLDRPLYIQYGEYLWNMLQLDLGKTLSPVRGRDVAADIFDHFPATLELSIAGMLITGLVGISTGAYAAHHRRSAPDYVFRIYSIVVYAIPVFWLGLMFQLIFGVYLGWLPVAGRITNLSYAPQHITGLYLLDSLLTRDWVAFQDSLLHLILPATTLGLYLSGIFTRLTRSNMLQVLKMDFITAARARGIPERTVVYRHGLKNAVIPIITMMGLQFALLLAGAVLTESTFSWPGLGRFLVERITYRDFPSIQGAVVVFALLVAGMSLLVDLIYAWVDPRIRY